MNMDRQKVFEKIFKEHLKVETYSKSIDSLYSPRSRNKINFKPYYQRNYVWDNNKASYFIESILLGTEIPPLIFFNNNEEVEVIDGRQRFETILRFINNSFSLTKRGLNSLKQLKGSSWDSLARSENDIIESFLDAKLRIIEFQLVNEPPLDKYLEDQVKKEIFSRYNSGITPLKKFEIDNAVYDNDELTNSFKAFFEENHSLKILVYQTFFKQLKKDSQDPPIENILSFIRRFLVLPSFPINYFSRGTGRTDILAKLYGHFSDSNIDNHFAIINSFSEKARFIHSVKKYSNVNSLRIHRLALECFLWGLGVLDLEEVKYELNSDLIVKIARYIDKNIDEYDARDFAFSKEVMARFSATAIFLQEEFNVDMNVYINADESARKRITQVKRPEDAVTKLSELESLRLNKPEPSRNSIDDIVRMMNRRKFMVRPSYQRKEVINPKKASSIIESILLGITLPPIFVYKHSNGVHEVIDGQQRLLTILGFIGSTYINEKEKTSFSKNHKFSLRKLRILKELTGEKFENLNGSLQDKIYDFQLYVVEIDENPNPNFNPIDLFIRLNDKPYPIREHSFEMWNSWADIEIIQCLKDLKKKLDSWFFVKQIKKATDRDRMENEELLTTISFLEYLANSSDGKKSIDIYQKTDRINARIRNKARISSLMQELNEEEEKKKLFFTAIKGARSFVKKLKYVLLDQDKPSDELNLYLKSELNEIFKAGKDNRYFRRTIQDFYFMWLFLGAINFEMVKYHRLDMKKELKDAFYFIKNIPEEDWENNLGLMKFQKILNAFKSKYSKNERRTKLNEKEKLDFIKAQGNISSISGAPVFLGDDIEVDHITPLAIGGEDKKSNLGIVHKDENRSKGAKENPN
ncbi:hypothetical protein AB834_00510 [PVC group bacterium (ex Bugula neritina AB1)]|nr:hypothetical protein AB834_00510 [PVC group bacterium (ex Bugula neritina AB1)]